MMAALAFFFVLFIYILNGMKIPSHSLAEMHMAMTSLCQVTRKNAADWSKVCAIFGNVNKDRS